VVDDAPDMRTLARAVLEGAGIEVVAEAADGLEALEQYRELAPPRVPTVVLLDNMMPGLTGMEVARYILAEWPGQLIVMFSAFLTDELETEARQLGIAACMSKIDMIDLPAVMTRVADTEPGGV